MWLFLGLLVVGMFTFKTMKGAASFACLTWVLILAALTLGAVYLVASSHP